MTEKRLAVVKRAPPANAGQRKVRPMQVIGTTGLRQIGGFIDEEFLARLRGKNGVQFYRQMMDNCSTIGTIMFIVKSLVRQAPAQIEAANDSTEAMREKVFVEEALKDMSHTFEDFISEVLSFLGYGWSYFEQTYKLRKGDTNDPRTRSQYTDGRWAWRRIDIRGQETLWQWLFDDEDDGGLLGMVQLDQWANRGSVTIPIEKSLLFRTETTKGNPEGKSLLRPAVRDYHYLTRLQEIEAVGFERDLNGMPVMQVPRELLLPDAGPEELALRRQLEFMIQQIRVDERWGGLMPAEINPDGTNSGFKLALLSSGGKRAVDIDTSIRRYETRIAMTFLCEFVMLGQEKIGTQALFQGKSNLFGIALGTLLDIIASTFNRFGIGRLMQLNGVPRPLWPSLKFGEVVSPDLEKIGGFVQQMAGAGLLSPNRQLENKMLGMAALPPPDEEDTEAFNDPSVPTPGAGPDMASGLLSDQQINAVLRVNAALRKGDLDREAALELLGSALGMDTGAAARYLTAKAPELEKPVDEEAPADAPDDGSEIS